MRLRRKQIRILLAAGLIVAVWAARQLSGPEPDGGAELIRQAFEDRRSGVMVEAAGTVERLLADDLEGSRHQRFILRLDASQTVLLSHNLDLAPRAPLALGDRVEFRGQYEWNERGGLVHWTHRDPSGRRDGGWLRHQGEIYR